MKAPTTREQAYQVGGTREAIHSRERPCAQMKNKENIQQSASLFAGAYIERASRADKKVAESCERPYSQTSMAFTGVGAYSDGL